MHDFQFRLYDDTLATTQTAGTGVVAQTLPVTDGIFTAEIDFGAVPFDGTQRYLEVRVKASGPGGFSVMDPLQPLTVTPQAIFALKSGEAQVAASADAAPWSGITGLPPGFADDVDNDTLGGLSCQDGKIAKFEAGGWSCADDETGPPAPVYTAGAGLTMSGTEFSVQFLGAGAVNGTATSAARSDHTHFGQKWTNAGVTASTRGLEIEVSGASVAVYGRTTGNNYAVIGDGLSFGGVQGLSSSGAGVSGFSQSGRGVLGLPRCGGHP